MKNEWFDGEIADEIKNPNRLLKKLKNQNYTMTKIIMWQGINYRKRLLTKKSIFLKTN